MDYFIYYRVLEHLAKYEKSTMSGLVFVGGLNWINNPVNILHKNGFLLKTTGDYEGATYFVLTDLGRELHKKMKIFFDEYEKMLSQLNVRKLKRKGYD